MPEKPVVSENVRDTLARTNRQIARIETVLDDLLDGINIEEMTAKERLDVAVKLMSQQGRALMIRQTCESSTPSGRTDIIIAAIARQMRGEIMPDNVVNMLSEDES